MSVCASATSDVSGCAGGQPSSPRSDADGDALADVDELVVGCAGDGVAVGDAPWHALSSSAAKLATSVERRAVVMLCSFL
jgi:hypothetical protein